MRSGGSKQEGMKRNSMEMVRESPGTTDLRKFWKIILFKVKNVP